ncbi:(2Fe-2S)-binding protein [Streptomyces sp. 6N106]|uniref:(2Fe-2S)-binding protein n=1 Tax=Streptomyces sp. 6N106 TaxID=3457418 RepID=UPI003FD16D30
MSERSTRSGPPPYRLTFDGATVTALPGQSVGAALMAAGIVAWRTTRREGRPRGLFCGIGVCFDCLITVDGRPGQRACLVPARDGMRLSAEGGDGGGGGGGDGAGGSGGDAARGGAGDRGSDRGGDTARGGGRGDGGGRRDDGDRRGVDSRVDGEGKGGGGGDVD